MKKHKLLTTAGLLSLLLLFSLFFFKTDAQAAKTRTTTLDVSAFTSDQEIKNEGWSWDHAKKILTLKGVDIQPEKDDGIILPKSSCTIVIQGNNSVKGFSNAIGCKLASYDDENVLGTLTINGSGTLNLDAYYTAIGFKGNVVVKDIDYVFTAKEGFNDVFKITFDNAHVNATKKDTQVDYSSPLIGVDPYAGLWDGFSSVTKYIKLNSCYVNTGGATIKHNADNIYIGYTLGHPAKTIEINRGLPPAKVSKVSTTSIKFTKNYKNLGISWKIPKYASGTFTVWRSTKKGSGYKKIATVTRPYYLNKGLRFNKTYYYKIRAYTKGKSSSYSVSGYKKVVTGLGKVKEFYFVPGKLEWKKGYGAQGYEIYRAKSLKGTYKRIKTITKGSIVSYKTNTKNYYFKIRSYRKVGSKKKYSPFVIAEDNYDDGIED